MLKLCGFIAAAASCSMAAAQTQPASPLTPWRVVLLHNADFGQRIQMSHDQLRDLVADVKSGVLDGVLQGTPA